jgi:hypothetical protein
MYIFLVLLVHFLRVLQLLHVLAVICELLREIWIIKKNFLRLFLSCLFIHIYVYIYVYIHTLWQNVQKIIKNNSLSIDRECNIVQVFRAQVFAYNVEECSCAILVWVAEGQFVFRFSATWFCYWHVSSENEFVWTSFIDYFFYFV